MYSSGPDKILTRYENEKQFAKMSLEAGAKSISLNDELICVLTFKDDVVLLDAKDLSLKSTQKLKFEGTAIILSGNELWIGDKTGKIHICDHNLAES